MKILVSDVMQIRLQEALKAAANLELAEWAFCPSSDIDRLEKEVADAEIFIGSLLTPSMAALGRNLGLVQVAGAGVDRISMENLAPSVTVANTYHHGAAIAEYVVMAMLALSRSLLVEDRKLRSGEWAGVFQDPTAAVHTNLAGKTLGVVGFGEIGSRLPALANCFGMHVHVVRKGETACPPGVDSVGVGHESLRRLLAEADFVVLTVPLTAETRGMIGTPEIAAMKPSAHLINVARAELVEQEALYRALATKRIAGAAIDVWWTYPSSGHYGRAGDFPFHELDNVLMTPHSSGMTVETFRARLEDVAGNIRAYASGMPLRHVVRAADPNAGTFGSGSN